VRVPEFILKAVEGVAFAAREDRRVDQTAGVSQRLSISLLELVAASAEARGLRLNAPKVARPLDLYGALPAITGKLELEYEGELQGAEKVARDLVQKAFGLALGEYLKTLNTAPILSYFEEGNLLTLPEDPQLALEEAGRVPGLLGEARKLAQTEAELVPAAEFILEGLVGRRKLARGEASYQAAERTRGYGN
ncbi:MAG: magnesium chelatase, partial [Thermus sp.]